MTSIPALTRAQLARSISARVRRRLVAGQIESGDDISALRRFVDLSQTEFAQAMGISVHTLRNWEQGRRKPDGPALGLLRIAARHPRIIRENVKQPHSALPTPYASHLADESQDSRQYGDFVREELPPPPDANSATSASHAQTEQPCALIETVNFDSAEKFIEALEPSRDFWRTTGGIWDQNTGGRNWFFRGQGNANWNLTPKALRPGTLRHYGIGASGAVAPTSLEEQLRQEHEEVARFIRRSIRAGLPVPEDGQWVRSPQLASSAFRKEFSELAHGINFPFPLHRSLVALAQHHGVPTRLLDWTEKPLVAAYFACRKTAEDVVKERNARRRDAVDALRDSRNLDSATPPAGRIAIWAVRQLAFHYSSRASDQHHLDPALEIVEAPFDSNSNLRAQRGLFTLVSYRLSRPADSRLPSLDDVIRQLAEIFGSENAPWLRKLTLPHSEAPKLLRLLDGSDVSASSVFPSYYGVVASIREREFFE